MPLPVGACSDEELEDYAAVEPAAAQELARRIAQGAAQRDADLREAQDEIRTLESRYDDLIDQAQDCCSKIRKLCAESEISASAAKKFLDVVDDLEGYL
ncbi:hypothetical protein [Ectopseudomonas guguanensis]|uniref:hypothetical protein n=1 Tax=Ectopseudomonas guguanensis TaxID=1198456 RepID=UPI0028B0B779|nr:hypothetical protein [Pseudomonas guguanensis]